MQKFFILYRKVLKQRQPPKTRSFLLRTIYMKKLLNFWLGKPGQASHRSPSSPRARLAGARHNPMLIKVKRKLTDCESIKLWAPEISKPQSKVCFSPRKLKWTLLLKVQPDLLPKDGRKELILGSIYQLLGAFAIAIAPSILGKTPGDRLSQPRFTNETNGKFERLSHLFKGSQLESYWLTSLNLSFPIHKMFLKVLAQDWHRIGAQEMLATFPKSGICSQVWLTLRPVLSPLQKLPPHQSSWNQFP